MKRFFDIRINWNSLKNLHFNKKGSLEGRIAVDRDGWFDGVIRTRKGNDLVFGCFQESEYIELYRINSKSKTTHFRGRTNGEVINGEYTFFNDRRPEENGIFNFTSEEIEVVPKDDIELDFDVSVARYKMSAIDQEFYNTMYTNRISLYTFLKDDSAYSETKTMRPISKK